MPTTITDVIDITRIRREVADNCSPDVAAAVSTLLDDGQINDDDLRRRILDEAFKKCSITVADWLIVMFYTGTERNGGTLSVTTTYNRVTPRPLSEIKRCFPPA